MGARHYDLVELDVKKLSYDMAEYGITQGQLSRSLGKSEGYISTLISRRQADRSTIEAIEDRMFKDRGAYVIELDSPKQNENKTAAPTTCHIDSSALRVNMNNHFSDVEKRLELVEKAIKELAAKDDGEQILSKMNQMIILMNRMLELWGGAKK